MLAVVTCVSADSIERAATDEEVEPHKTVDLMLSAIDASEPSSKVDDCSSFRLFAACPDFLYWPACCLEQAIVITDCQPQQPTSRAMS
jgi:hypothetical protein